MRKVAARQGKSLPSTASLIAMLSRWVNDHERPSRFYREILSGALGLDQAELQSGSGQELEVKLPDAGSDDRLLVEYPGTVDGALLDDFTGAWTAGSERSACSRISVATSRG